MESGASRGRGGRTVRGGILLAAVAAAVVATSCTGEEPAEDERPDIVLVVVDTLRADHVGVYGSARPTTPELDALAREGAHYLRAYAQSSWTLPSMTSLLTGLLPHQHRVGRHPTDERRFGRLAPEIPTLAERLGEAGYARAAIVNNTFLAPEFGLSRGFEDYDYHGATKERVRSAEETVDAAARFAERSDRPFFLLVHFMEPHLFYDPPASVRGAFTGDGPAPVEVPFGSTDGIARLSRAEGDAGRAAREYVERLYDEEILYVDGAIGRLVAVLRARPRWDRTVVIVTADHGEEFFDHGGFEHGHTLYGELVRVPLIVTGPGLDRGEVTGVVQHVDVARGILALANARTEGLAEGIDPFAWLRAGRDPGDRPSLSENVLYGPPRVAYTDGRDRLHRRLDRPSGEVFRLSPEGVEAGRLEDAERRVTARRLARALVRARGDLAPWQPTATLRLANDEILGQLEALGYVRDD